MEETLTMKQIVQRAMKSLPEENIYDVGMERLLLLSEIEERLNDIHPTTAYPLSEFAALFAQWEKK